jgi:hypothetical protein
MTSKLAQEGVNTEGKERQIKEKDTKRQITLTNSIFFEDIIY